MSVSEDPAAPRLRLAPELKREVTVGQVWAGPVSVTPTAAKLQAEIDASGSR